jgi:formate dehydrogenase maturation protein FdhE
VRRSDRPGDFERRLARAKGIAAPESSAQPLAFLVTVLDYQGRRAREPDVREAAAKVAARALPNRIMDSFPLLDLDAASRPVTLELEPAVEALTRPVSSPPAPLVEAGRSLCARPVAERLEFVERWLDDASLLDPRLAIWVRIGAGPILELAAAHAKPPSRDEWTGRACPLCGDVPQCSVIVEESGGFLQGSPRYLVCGRCAGWWAFSRATCPSCGEDDSTKVSPYVAEGFSGVRLDVCETCRGYIKTFDLREAGQADVVPLVDDVASLTLDVWAREVGLARPGMSLAGV